jgi:hypothetical protein
MSSFFPEKKKKKKKKKKEKESLAQGVVVVVYPSREGKRKFGKFASIFLPKRRTSVASTGWIPVIITQLWMNFNRVNI